MTTQTLIFVSPIQPSTVTLVPWGGGTAITGSGITAAGSNRTGWFKATFTGAVGKYSFHGLDGSGNLIVDDVAIMLDTTAEQFVLGLLGANVQAWQDTLVPTPDTAGYPVATVKHGTGTGELSLSAGVIQADLAKLLGSTAVATALQNLVKGMLTVTASNHDTLLPTAFDVTASGLTAAQIPVGSKLRVATVGSDAINAGAFVTVTSSTDITTDIVGLVVEPALPATPTTSTVLALVAADSQLTALATELTTLLAGSDGYTLIEIIRIGIAILAGLASGATANGGTIVFKSLDGAVHRVTAITDSFGNRTGIVILPD